MHPISKAIRIQLGPTAEKEHSNPLFLTSSFCFDDAEEMRAVFADEKEANIYSRFVNPNAKELEQKMAVLEGMEAAYAVASGMAAMFATFMALLQQGDCVLACNAIFGSTHTLFSKYFPKYGIAHKYIAVQATAAEWEAAIDDKVKMIFLETPTNPGLDLIDLQMIGAIAKKHNILLVVDNCFATPLIQQPVLYGADIVIHSGTKWIDGQGRVLGGIVCGSKSLINDIYLFSRSAGPAISPFNAWILSKSLETLDVRMERHASNALYLAEQLADHPAIEWLKYPYLPSHPQYAIALRQMKNGGGLFTFNLKAGLQAGRQFLNALKMLSLTANLGDTRSIASHPASTTHAKLTAAERLNAGISPGLIRISVGLEHRDDILEDILQALASV
jgi:O-succinylhomoserine sulfhydrylase